MTTDLSKIISQCDEVLKDKEYVLTYQCKIHDTWRDLSAWMEQRDITEFTEEVGFQYADETFGDHILSESLNKKYRTPLRAVRMLTSYQKDGMFEFRAPSVERHFEGNIGLLAQEYLDQCRTVTGSSEKTLSNKERYLLDFSYFINESNLSIADISMDIVSDFFTQKDYTLSSRHNCNTCLKSFFHFLFDQRYTNIDYSIFVLADAYKKNNKVPTTYNEEEIKKMLDCVERGSAIGKRDYLILLLAAEYGWRTGDIVNFRFDQIDWDLNVIRFEQSKTGAPVEYPLLASVGNAIIDWLQHGRPDTTAPEIIVSLSSESRGNPLSPPTIHSIVSRYLKAANIKDWSKKRHGAHSLRHSLATNMLKKNVSLPVISTVLGHQTTETTKVYLKVDVDKLSECPLPMPAVHSIHYRGVKNI